MEGENKETKITLVEKERVKDPRRVEQGKRLAAISREAKERKGEGPSAARGRAAARTAGGGVPKSVRVCNSHDRSRTRWILPFPPLPS